jgi:hypothetical protein
LAYDPLNAITGIGHPTQQSHALGVARLRLVPVDWVVWVYQPNVTSEPLPPGCLALVPGRQPIEVAVRPEFCTFAEDQEPDASGLAWRAAIQVTLPKERIQLLEWFTEAANVRWLALVLDVAGQARLVGSLEHPLEMGRVGASVGRTGSGRVFTLSAQGAQPSYFLQGVTDAQVLGTRRFNHRYPFRCQ